MPLQAPVHAAARQLRINAAPHRLDDVVERQRQAVAPLEDQSLFPSGDRGGQAMRAGRAVGGIPGGPSSARRCGDGCRARAPARCRRRRFAGCRRGCARWWWHWHALAVASASAPLGDGVARMLAPMGFQGMRKSTMMPNAEPRPATATPASSARRRQHHREFPAGIPRRVAPQQSPLPLRRPRQSTSTARPRTIDSAVLMSSHPRRASAAPATSTQPATAAPPSRHLPGRNTCAGEAVFDRWRRFPSHTRSKAALARNDDRRPHIEVERRRRACYRPAPALWRVA